MRRFAPKLYFHPDEEWWVLPNYPLHFIYASQLKYNIDNYPDPVIVDRGDLTVLNLPKHSINKEIITFDIGFGDIFGIQSPIRKFKQEGRSHWYQTIMNNDLVQDRFFMKPSDLTTSRPQRELPIYVHVRPQLNSAGDDVIGTVIQYWFFYYKNPTMEHFSHDGDWEHIDVYTSLEGYFKYANYSQHNGTKRYCKASDITTYNCDGVIAFYRDTNNEITYHPEVYVAKGSHANYNEGDQAYTIVSEVGIDFWIDYTSYHGITINSWEEVNFPTPELWYATLYNVGEKLALFEDTYYFIKYGGRWGDIGNLQEVNLDFTSGPYGPAFKAVWGKTYDSNGRSGMTCKAHRELLSAGTWVPNDWLTWCYDYVHDKVDLFCDTVSAVKEECIYVFQEWFCRKSLIQED